VRGFEAIGTSSAGVAFAAGRPDGGPARSAMALTRLIADELYRDGVSVAMGESTIGYRQANELLSKED
jgi:hypothetical protein